MTFDLRTRDKAAEALKQRFAAIVETHGGTVGPGGVAMPSDDVWLDYADAVLQALPAQGGWMPIETAPATIGACIPLAYRAGGGPTVTESRRTSTGWETMNGAGPLRDGHRDIIGWTPKPLPPPAGTVSTSTPPYWAVTVSIDGDEALKIEPRLLSGIPDIEKYAGEIREAAQNLLSFIGPVDPEPFIVDDDSPPPPSQEGDAG